VISSRKIDMSAMIFFWGRGGKIFCFVFVFFVGLFHTVYALHLTSAFASFAWSAAPSCMADARTWSYISGAAYTNEK
jgi:hypothetical protein